MKKRILVIMLSLCMLFSMLLVGCNKSENTNETNNEPTQESETDQGNETTNESELSLDPPVERVSLDKFAAMLVKEGMLKKTSDLEAKTWDTSFYCRGKITTLKGVSFKGIEYISLMIFYDKDTKKVIDICLFVTKRPGAATAYNSEVKQSIKAMMKFMNSAMTEQQLEEVASEMDPKGELDKAIHVNNKYGMYYYCEEFSKPLVGHCQIDVSYEPNI